MYRKSLALHIKKIWLQHSSIGALLVFCIAAILFTLWTATPSFTDPDSFYHLKIAELISKNKQAVVDFPWLPYTTLAGAYVDHHFLYHVALIPFMLVFGSFIGMKIATIFFAASCITLFYIILRSLHVRYAFVFSMILLCTESFTFRLGLAKAPSIGFLFLMGGFALLAHKYYKALGILSFFFVWSYGGFLLLPIMIFFYTSIAIAEQIFKKRRWISRAEFVQQLTPLFATLSGTILGLLIHPSFPQHLQFYWQQIIQIGLVNYQDTIGVGGEWHPTQFHNLVTSSIFISFLLLIAIITFVVSYRKQTTLSKTAGLMMVVFFIFTLKSQRYIEYYIPWACVFGALSLHASGLLHRSKYILNLLSTKLRRHPLYTVSICCFTCYLFFIVSTVAILNTQQASSDLHDGISIHRFEQSAQWLREHSTKGDIVFHSDWDDFPMLFYYVPRDYFIAGLDPTFMYNANQDLYWKWVHITTGKKSDELLGVIHGDFNARFVFIDSDHDAMRKNIIRDGRFKLVYEDEEVTIFRVPR